MINLLPPRCLLSLLALCLSTAVFAQPRPYIGYVYPAGGQQGATFRVKLGGQGLEDVQRAFVTGAGVTARVVQYDRVLNPQEITLLNEQLRQLKRTNAAANSAMVSPGTQMMVSDTAMMSSATDPAAPSADKPQQPAELISRIEKRVAETVNRPASAALASIVYVEVRIAADAPPGSRELRLATGRGISNPLVFYVGQLPERTRKPMITASLQVLGKEALALRKRPASEVEEQITIPCTANGQIASGELNRYRFKAAKGQDLVITTQARQLIPFIADAVPGWFQPVLVLRDGLGKEVAYDDDYRFKPDPTILFHVPNDGEYTFEIYDAIYRGREDFVYRISIGELPFVTSIFPLGARVGTSPEIEVGGRNLRSARLTARCDSPAQESQATTINVPGALNPQPFRWDALPEAFDKEPNSDAAHAQAIQLPIIINGRIDRAGDWDAFQFSAKSNDVIVAEVWARRLDSPLDSILKLTDAKGTLLAFNDDQQDPGAGINTHDADSYLKARLPADGSYRIFLGDTAHNGGPEFGYRLRLSAPQPDFALRVVPSSLSLRGKSSGTLNVHVLRKDGFTGPIKLALRDPPAGFTALPVAISGTNTMARLNVKTTLVSTPEPVDLAVLGTATIDGREVTHAAVPAEDRMQAFYWRHLVPAADLKVLVFDPNYQPRPKRVPPAGPQGSVEAKLTLAGAEGSAKKPAFSKQQVAGRLRQLKLLYEEALITDAFYNEKVAECEAAQ